MFNKLKADILFTKLLKRPNINKAYAMVQPTDSWYDTICTVHNSLKEIQELPHDTLEIYSHDNLKLKGIYYPAKKNCKVTVICIHGYTSHAEREWAYPGLFYLSLGYNVLIPYQRAHGLSEGKFISFGALEYKDMLQWVEKINKMNPEDSIIIHGLSMGGGIALDLADKAMKNVKGIIADAPSLSIRNFFESIVHGVFKTDAKKIVQYVEERFKKEFHADVEEFERVQTVANSKYPILLAAGSKENREELFEEIKKRNPKNTEIIILPGCDHGNGMYKQTDLYQEVIKNFINKFIC